MNAKWSFSFGSRSAPSEVREGSTVLARAYFVLR